MKQMKLIKADQQPTSRWAGGTTTQIYIYPEDASYPERSFIWRLSTAQVELEESNFTKLEGYDRYLMVLEGELKLLHMGHHSTQLSQFEQDCFKGGWDTTSYGQARDFNLMVREGLKGFVEYIGIEAGTCITRQYATAGNDCSYGLYCYKGQVEFAGEENQVILEEGDLLMITGQRQLSFTLKNAGTEKGSVIAAIIE